LDEEASDTLAGKESRQPRQDRSIGRLQHWSMDLASQHRHLVTQHDDFDREVCVSATGEPNQLEDAAERPVKEREGHWRMLAPRESGRQSPDNSRWMAFSAPTGLGRLLRDCVHTGTRCVYDPDPTRPVTWLTD